MSRNDPLDQVEVPLKPASSGYRELTGSPQMIERLLGWLATVPGPCLWARSIRTIERARRHRSLLRNRRQDMLGRFGVFDKPAAVVMLGSRPLLHRPAKIRKRLYRDDGRRMGPIFKYRSVGRVEIPDPFRVERAQSAPEHGFVRAGNHADRVELHAAEVPDHLEHVLLFRFRPWPPIQLLRNHRKHPRL